MAQIPNPKLAVALLMLMAMPTAAVAQEYGSADLAGAAAALDQAQSGATTSTGANAAQRIDGGPPTGAIGGVVLDLDTVPIARGPVSRWTRESATPGKATWVDRGHHRNSETARYMAERVVDPQGRNATGFNAKRARGARWNRRATFWMYHQPNFVRPEPGSAD